jgi:S-adenosylmethionine decarboxylase
MRGLHLTADLHGCPVDRPAMTDVATLRECCLSAVMAAGLQPVGELFHCFAAADAHSAASAGITGVVLLAESHVAVHTWPELGAVTLDVYVCNFGTDNSQRAELLLATLTAGFAPAAVHRHALERGE